MNKKTIAILTQAAVLVSFTLILLFLFTGNFELSELLLPIFPISLIVYYLKANKQFNPFYVFILVLTSVGYLFFSLDYEILGYSCFLLCFLFLIWIVAHSVKIEVLSVFFPGFFVFSFVSLTIWLFKGKLDYAIVFELVKYIILVTFMTLSLIKFSQKKTRGNIQLLLGVIFFSLGIVLSFINENVTQLKLVNQGLITGLYLLGQLLLCTSVVNNSLKVIKLTQEIIYNIIFISLATLGAMCIVYKSYDFLGLTVVLFLGFLPVVYYLKAYVVSYVFLIHMFLVFVGEYLMNFTPELLLYNMLITITAQIILVFLIIKYNRFNKKRVLIYFLISFTCYLILHSQVLKFNFDPKFISFGLMASLMLSLALDNYLNQMCLANYLLWLGVAFTILNYVIISVDLKGANTNLYCHLTNLIGHFLIYRSFLIRLQLKIGNN